MRLAVNKTYKMLIGGAFVRSESNRTLSWTEGSPNAQSPGGEGGPDINYCRATRKDVRDAVGAARAAFGGWSGRTAYNRGQILYRMAEMLEARSDEFDALLSSKAEVQACVDRLLYYAGWSDKFQQLLGTVNPVAAPYFNFSVPEPMGVVGIAAGGDGLLGLVSLVAPAIVGGNTCVAMASDTAPIVACEFAEVVATSDVPGGVVNILTGSQNETVPHLAKHMDVNALVLSSSPSTALVDDATENLKRLRVYEEAGQGLSWIADLQETKTVWHPIGV